MWSICSCDDFIAYYSLVLISQINNFKTVLVMLPQTWTSGTSIDIFISIYLFLDLQEKI